MVTVRQRLVEEAVWDLADWNFRAWLSEIGEPHESDRLPESIKGYLARCNKPNQEFAIRDYSDAHAKLESVVNREPETYDEYYMRISDLALTRLCNEVEHKAAEKVEERKGRYLYWKNTGNTEYMNRMRGRQ